MKIEIDLHILWILQLVLVSSIFATQVEQPTPEFQVTFPLGSGSYSTLRDKINTTTQKYEERIFSRLDKYAEWNTAMIKRIKDGSLTFDSQETNLDNGFSGVLVLTMFRTGFGNRVEGFISGLLYAMVTNRVLVVDPDCEPLERELDLFWNNIPLFPESLMDFQQLYPWDKMRRVDFSVDPITTESLTEIYKNDPVIQFFGNVYSGSILFYNPTLELQMEEWFGPRSLYNNPVHVIQKWLWRPSSEVTEKVEEFEKKHFADKEQVIVLHVRATETFAVNTPGAVFFDCADQVLQSLKETDSYVIYLATDNHNIQVAAKEYFGDRVVWFLDVHEVSAKQMNLALRTDVSGMFVDLALMSKATHFVATKSSSFGRFAYSLANIPPRLISFNSDIWSQSALVTQQCQQSLTSKVCSHRFQKILWEGPNKVSLLPWDHLESTLECMND